MEFFDFLSQRAGIALNDAQKAAVTCVNGPELVLAGPGSGKTAVITARAAYLCMKTGVPPAQVLTLAFNRAATREMEERFERFFGEAVGDRVHFSTIHSFCNRVIHAYERRQGQTFRRIETEEQESGKNCILREIYQTYNHSHAGDDELETLSAEISTVKNGMIRNTTAFRSQTRNFSLIFKAYEDFKREHRLIDFDDMLCDAYTVLRKCPDILETYRRRCRYIQVDEGQDLSKIQFEILSLLVGEDSPNLCIVADDDQSIYGFRGAAPQYILNFADRYTGCHTFRLETNYRSSREIVDLSSRFIARNRNRMEKKYRAARGTSAKPRIEGVTDESAQTEFILHTLETLAAKGRSQTAAVIYRNNLSSIALVDALERKGVHFRLRQSRTRFFGHWVVQDVRTMLRFALDMTDADAFHSIYYKIKRYISKAMIEHADTVPGAPTYIDALLDSPNLQPYQLKQLGGLKDEFQSLSQMAPALAMDWIDSEFSYGEYIGDFCEKTRASHTYATNVFGAMRCIAARCTTISEFIQRMSRLDELFHSGDLTRRRAPLTLTTMHSAKGLEFDTVFLVDLTGDEIPGDMRNGVLTGDVAMEEERRLLYVALTRARSGLYLLYPRSRGGVPAARSPFVSEAAECLDEPLCTKPDEGMTVFHRKFGEGVIKSVNKQGDHLMLVVAFQDCEHTLDYNLCVTNGLLSLQG